MDEAAGPAILMFMNYEWLIVKMAGLPRMILECGAGIERIGCDGNRFVKASCGRLFPLSW